MVEFADEEWEEAKIKTWQSKDGWVAAVMWHEKFYYSGGKTKEEALKRLYSRLELKELPKE